MSGADTMTEQSATSADVEEWDDENDEPHPVFRVEHRPERKRVAFDEQEESA